MRLEFNDEENAMIELAERLTSEADALRKRAIELRDTRDNARPLLERLVFAADARCNCGAGMAYDPTGEVTRADSTPFRAPSAWDCSRLLLNAPRDLGVPEGHDHLPFAFWQIKSEYQPSANGRTTRPKS